MDARKLTTAFVLLAICACQQEKSSLSETEQVRVAEDVRQALNNYLAAVKKEGLTAEFSYLDNSEDFFWVPPGYQGPISYDSVAAILKVNAPLFKSIENSFDTLRIIPLSEGLAAYTTQLHSVMTDTSGKVSFSRLIETGVVIKRKDGWKLLGGQTSLITQKE
jgi:hypothetical protein